MSGSKDKPTNRHEGACRHVAPDGWYALRSVGRTMKPVSSFQVFRDSWRRTSSFKTSSCLFLVIIHSVVKHVVATGMFLPLHSTLSRLGRALKTTRLEALSERFLLRMYGCACDVSKKRSRNAGNASRKPFGCRLGPRTRRHGLVL